MHAGLKTPFMVCLMEITLVIIIILAVIAIAAIIAAPTVYVRMRRRLELANETHAQILTHLEQDHDERLARLKRDAEQSRRYAHHQLALEVLPVIDALDEASKYATSVAQAANANSVEQPALQHGVTLAKKQLLQALERHGIEYIAPCTGDAFEPMCHEAVHLVEDESLPARMITRCLRAGFRQEDRVLRSAMVEVVSGSAAPPPAVILPESEPISESVSEIVPETEEAPETSEQPSTGDDSSANDSPKI